MALVPVWCDACGLEIDSDDRIRPYNGSLYHDFPYPCCPEQEDPDYDDGECP